MDYKTSQSVAVEAVNKILGFYPTIPASDPESFATGLVQLLMDYPTSVVSRATDPVRGIPCAVSFLNLADVKLKLDKWFTEYLDEQDRRKPPPRRLQAPDEDPEMAKRVSSGLKELADQIGRGIGPSTV